MKRTLNQMITLAAVVGLLLLGSVFGQISGVATQPGQFFPSQLNPATTTTSQAGLVTNPSSNFIINVTGGPVVCYGSETFYMQPSQITLQANSTNLLVFSCIAPSAVYTKQAVTGPGSSGTTVGVPTSLLYADPQKGEIAMATIVCGSTNCGNTANGTITDNRSASNFPIVTDGYYIVPPGACAWNQSGGTLVTNGLANVGASFLPVNQISTTTTTLTAVLSCVIAVPSKLTAGKGVIIADVTLLYGPSTGTLQSCAAPSISTIALPTAGTSETPSTVTPVAISGALTVTPVVGSCNVTALTAGAMYTEKVALATPFNMSTDLQFLEFSQSFVGANAASEILYTGGLIVHYSYLPL